MAASSNFAFKINDKQINTIDRFIEIATKPLQTKTMRHGSY